jgi:hypothetical protein
MADSLPFQISEYIKASSEAFVLLKTLYPLLPTQNRDEVEAKIYAAEEAFQKANVVLASAWNYKLCRCTFPPQIMLWNKTERTSTCPRCGDKNPPPPKADPDYEDEFISIRR